MGVDANINHPRISEDFEALFNPAWFRWEGVGLPPLLVISLSLSAHFTNGHQPVRPQHVDQPLRCPVGFIPALSVTVMAVPLVSGSLIADNNVSTCHTGLLKFKQ